MEVHRYLTKIQSALQGSLPGVHAHQKMSPANRPLVPEEISNLDSFRFSAVAIITFPIGDQIHCVLIQRPIYEGVHGGQVSFPGGKRDEGDKSLVETAIREVEEEIGWRLLETDMLGSLTEMFIPMSKFRVQPVLFFLERAQDFKPSDYEVEEVIVFPLKRLLDEDAVQLATIKISSGMSIKNVPYFDLEGRVVWGATAVILSEFREMLLT